MERASVESSFREFVKREPEQIAEG
jgi:hypothetical protein